MGVLSASNTGDLERDVIEAALAREFPPADPRTQVDTLIRWGRYAELFEYDDRREVLSRAPGLPGEPEAAQDTSGEDLQRR